MIGFLGVGNMGGAILKGMLFSNQFKEEDIIGCDHNADIKKEIYGIKFVEIDELLRSSDTLILAIKPQALNDIKKEVKDFKDKHIISLLAGVDISSIKEIFNTDRITLVMPNTPAMVLKAMSGICHSTNVKKEERELTNKIFSSVGDIMEIKESEMNLFGTIAGATPAYFFLMLDAFIDASIRLGFKADIARKIITKSMEGSAVLARESKLGLSDLKNMVTSPKGTTIEGIIELEKNGVRNAIIEAVSASTKKAGDMKK